MDVANIHLAAQLGHEIGELKAAALRWENTTANTARHGYHVAAEDFEAFKEASKRFIAEKMEKLHAEIAKL
jgi:hypothetical protein